MFRGCDYVCKDGYKCFRGEMGKNRGLVSVITIVCPDCDTSITCKIISRFGKDFICPVCGLSLNANFEHALKSAIAYNKAALELVECQKTSLADFE